MRKIFFLLIFIISASIYPEDTPQRIISLGPAITKAVYLLGEKDRLIANTIYCPRSTQNKNNVEKVGTLIDVNIEKIYSLKPDLVLATTLLKPQERKKLEKLGLKVAVVSEPKNLEELCENFLKIAELLGKKRKAKKILKEVRKKVNSLTEKIKNLEKKRVLIQIGGKPLFIANQDSFLNDYIEYAGGINIAKDFSSGIASREKILQKNPEVIIITGMGLNIQEEKNRWMDFPSLEAVRNKQIYIIKDDDITSPTPLGFVKILEKIIKILHPHLK